MSFNATPKKKKWTKPIDNEKLQQLKCMHHFNKAMFTNKVKVYKRENIDIKNIQKTNTIFSDPSPLTKERFLNPNYKTPEVKPHEFSIKRTQFKCLDNEVSKSAESINIRTSNDQPPSEKCFNKSFHLDHFIGVKMT